jgi:hypothetical protein
VQRDSKDETIRAFFMSAASQYFHDFEPPELIEIENELATCSRRCAAEAGDCVVMRPG